MGSLLAFGSNMNVHAELHKIKIILSNASVWVFLVPGEKTYCALQRNSVCTEGNM